MINSNGSYLCIMVQDKSIVTTELSNKTAIRYYQSIWRENKKSV
jgi:hypothetical protein